ncbi:uncharacterized protein LOC121416994 isoform X2 [Lytechinus variegatus]|uniref:uncharacterized protein LOC121416994 isoform X2 n=1 Tax=Lytechinus variegatus TaxID=7654 RepID=UPI001BB23173|nr:uncharacterized protein LOC121416994 isoform X2 [Lytechinus variegatus]
MDTHITDEELLEIARKVCSSKVSDHLYQDLGLKLGQNLGNLERILLEKNNDYLRSTIEILMEWRSSSEAEPNPSSLEGILSSLRINTSPLALHTARSSQSSFNQSPADIPEPITGMISDTVLREIADSLETDDQMERLAMALGCTRAQINQCNTTNRLTGSVTTKGTIDLLTSWRATIQPEHQMSRMHEAMTRAKLVMIRETILVRAEKQQQDEMREYQRCRESQQQRDLAASNNQETTTSVDGSGDSTFSSLCSMDSGTNRSLTDQGEPERNIYLEFSQETNHVRKVKDIISRNNWTLMTAADAMLGVPKMTSIEDALKACSHVVLIITKEDCEKDDLYQTMTTYMALHPRVDGGNWKGRVIVIRCCDERYLPHYLQVLNNTHVDDSNLEERLRKAIRGQAVKKGESSSDVGTNSTQPMDESPRILMSTEPGSQPTTPVGSEVRQLCQQISYMSVHGNVYHIESVNITGGSHGMPQEPSVVPVITRQELSQRLNGHRVTLDDWKGLAIALGMEEVIDSLDHLADPTGELINLAEQRKKICSPRDLEDALKQMRRDDCVEVLQGGPAQLPFNNRQMIKDRKSSSSSDEG